MRIKEGSSRGKNNNILYKVNRSISNKTLAETLKTNEEKVRAAVKEINNELVKLQSELGFPWTK